MKKKFFLLALIIIFRFQNLFPMEVKPSFTGTAPTTECSASSATIPEPFASPFFLKFQIQTITDNQIYSISFVQGYRNSMEDSFDFKINKEKQFACFGIFDGHVGKNVSEFLKNNLFKNILESAEKEIPQKISTGFLKTNEEILNNQQIFQEGSTAITVFFFGNQLFTANVGDSRAIISAKKIASNLSCDHRGSNMAEVQRIQAAGGYFLNERLLGFLEPTRAFGDLAFKDYITAAPEITQITLADEHEYIILACDGLWDVITNQDAIDIILKQQTITEMSRSLVSSALNKGSGDNITVIVINLKELKKAFENHG